MTQTNRAAAAEKRQPWMKWYPGDWRADPALRMCGLAARGLWIELLGYMHEAQPYGHLVVAGRSPTIAQIAQLVGVDARSVGAAMAELEAAGVCSRDETGRLYSRRMLRDKAKAERDRANGKAGGNPRLRQAEIPAENPPVEGADIRGVNPPDKAQKPEARVTSSLRSDGAAASPPAPVVPLPVDARGELWGNGPARLARMTGKPDAACRAILGRLLREALDDCELVARKLAEAEALRVIDPVAWIEAAILTHTGRRAAALRPGQGSGFGQVVRQMRQASQATAGPGSVFDGTAEEMPAA